MREREAAKDGCQREHGERDARQPSMAADGNAEHRVRGNCIGRGKEAFVKLSRRFGGYGTKNVGRGGKYKGEVCEDGEF